MTQLSPRETEIESMMLQGLSNKGIARRLGLSEGTVRNHVTTVFNKRGCASRLELVIALCSPCEHSARCCFYSPKKSDV